MSDFWRGVLAVPAIIVLTALSLALLTGAWWLLRASLEKRLGREHGDVPHVGDVMSGLSTINMVQQRLTATRAWTLQIAPGLRVTLYRFPYRFRGADAQQLAKRQARIVEAGLRRIDDELDEARGEY
jgi:hypothetical protein